MRTRVARETLPVLGDEAVGVAAAVPAIVDHDIIIARLPNPVRRDRIGGSADHLFVDVAGEFIAAFQLIGGVIAILHPIITLFVLLIIS
nr:hypothetical protein [Sphingomonas sp. Leaf10]